MSKLITPTQGPAKNLAGLRRIMAWAQQQDQCPLCDDPECECWEALAYAISQEAQKVARG